MMKPHEIKIPGSAPVKSFLTNLALTAISALLFAGSFPNLLVENGLPFLAWIAYAPIFILLQRVSLGASVFWGALYGYAAYALFNYWLTAFHPLAGLIVGCIYLVYNAALFFFLRLAIVLFPRQGYLVQWLIWLAYEYLKTKGFLGYSYGITGYSQWRVIPLIQIANIFGVWGISALVVFPSAWIGQAIKVSREQRTEMRKRFFSLFTVNCSLFPFLIWLSFLAAALVYGFALPSDFSSERQANIALVQHNTDPWKGGLEEYRNNLTVLKRLSNEALEANPPPDMVVWPETAFVPRIYWHETYRDDPASWRLVKELLDYLSAQTVPFVIGNDDARKEPSKNPNANEGYRVDYNAAMLFENGRNTGVYRKLRLVPFTEHFPYKKQFPAIHSALVKADTHFWEKGTEAKVFDGPGFTFSTPICFEDTFGDISRKFTQNGAQIIVNLSNDAWSKSLPAQNQHLSMAVFRAAENRRSMVRATASGQTCGIAPDGRIIAMAPPFTEAVLTVAIPVEKGNTVYNRLGDLLPPGFIVAAVLLLLFGTVMRIIKNAGKWPGFTGGLNKIKEGLHE
jgi:apolipoprotein N-acyltransferase